MQGVGSKNYFFSHVITSWLLTQVVSKRDLPLIGFHSEQNILYALIRIYTRFSHTVRESVSKVYPSIFPVVLYLEIQRLNPVSAESYTQSLSYVYGCLPQPVASECKCSWHFILDCELVASLEKHDLSLICP